MTGSRNGARRDFDGGHKIKSVKIVSTNKGKSTESDAIYVITDTRMQVLPEALKLRRFGKIKIDFHIYLQRRFRQNRCLDTKNGKIFTIAQWYPRMCVR
jgi:hypothetical protein